MILSQNCKVATILLKIHTPSLFVLQKYHKDQEARVGGNLQLSLQQ